LRSFFLSVPSRIIPYLFVLVIAVVIQGCANIVPPEGGKKDETPPQLISIKPADSALNLRVSKIELRFNKYMEVKDLEKNLQLSPLLPINPTIISYGKRVEIKIADTQLLDNTTYRISLGDALVDNREANPYKDFNYVFSTGSYFDSLELHGSVYDAETGLPDTAALMVLYPEADIDSAVVRKKPQYAIKADASGKFIFRSLPMKPFHIYAVQDANNNYLYDYGEEKVGFLNQKVIPALGNDSSYVFYLFKDYVDTTLTSDKDTADIAEKDSRKDAFANRNTSKPAKSTTGYRVNVDTSDRAQRTVELTQDLSIDLYTAIKALDTGKVYLSYENGGIEVEAVQHLVVDSSKIKISTQWQPDKLYTLRLVKGWSKDTAGNELPPGKYFFRTKRLEDYGTLKLHISQQYFGSQYVLYVYKGRDSIYRKTITDSLITLPLLQPGDYGMRIILDENKNGKWDPGDLFARKQPEMVVPYTGSIIIKAGWDNEIDFLPPSKSGKGGKKSQDDKMEERMRKEGEK
jgi:hypothetical protein